MVAALSLSVLLSLSQPPAPAAPAPQPAPQPAPAPSPAPARPGVHGMVLFGGGDVPTYLSHIPMFRRPHDLQLVLQVSLQHPSWKGARTFLDTGYTVEPERMDLTALADGRLTAFTGTVF